MKPKSCTINPNIVYEFMHVSLDCLDDLCEFLGGEETRNIDFSINYRTGRVFIHGSSEGGKVGDIIVRAKLKDSSAGDFFILKPHEFRERFTCLEV